MVEARQQRGLERQQLLDGLMKELHDWEEESGDKVCSFELAAAILDYLQQRKEQAALRQMRQSEFFSERVFPKIYYEFGRTDEETDYLFAEFLRKVLEPALMPFSTALTTQEQDNPQPVFHTASAMAQVPLQEGSTT